MRSRAVLRWRFDVNQVEQQPQISTTFTIQIWGCYSFGTRLGSDLTADVASTRQKLRLHQASSRHSFGPRGFPTACWGRTEGSQHHERGAKNRVTIPHARFTTSSNPILQFHSCRVECRMRQKIQGFRVCGQLRCTLGPSRAARSPAVTRRI